jgi:hypothetical protein
VRIIDYQINHQFWNKNSHIFTYVIIFIIILGVIGIFCILISWRYLFLEKEAAKFEDRPITYLIKINDGGENGNTTRIK